MPETTELPREKIDPGIVPLKNGWAHPDYCYIRGGIPAGEGVNHLGMRTAIVDNDEWHIGEECSGMIDSSHEDLSRKTAFSPAGHHGDAIHSVSPTSFRACL